MRIGIRRIRKAGVAAAVAATTVVGLLPLAAGPAQGAAGFTVTAYAGADRYDTAAKMSVGAFTTADNVVIATGENFPDALAGNYLAGTQNAPILLVQKDTVPPTTKAALGTLKAKTVTLLGGVAAISTAVENELKGTTSTSAGGGNLTVNRIGGATRYDTAQNVNTAPPAAGVGSVSGKKTAFIATGQNFPDALYAGTVAWDLNFPMVLTTPQALSSQAKSTLTTLGIQQVLILGGTAAVSQAVETEINGMGITTLQRFAGADRIDTNVKLNQYAATLPGAKLSKFFVATADNFPDALTAGPAAGRTDFTLIHAVAGNALPASVKSNIETLNKPTATNGYVAGGDAVCNQACRDAVQTAGGGTAAAQGNTSRPELVSSSIVQTNATQGTTVKYCFDEAITGAALGALAAWHTYTAGDVKDPGGAATAAFTDAADTKCANVTFGGITTSAMASSLTVATVDAGVVTGTTGTAADTNPIGDAALGTTGTTTFTAGITAAPDLQTVGNFRADPTAPSTNTLVDFTFDEVAYFTAGAATYHLVQAAGNGAADFACTFVSGNGTATHTVTCVQPASGAFSATNVMRGYVDTGAVDDDAGAGPTGNVNPLEAADVAGSGTTDTPDLVSCTFLPTTKGTDATSDIDRVLFKFDEPVNTGVGPAASFNVYQATGAEVGGSPAGPPPPGFTAPSRSTANDTDVSVDYPDGTLANAVGCSVDAGAVAEATNAANTNLPDEVGVANSGIAQTAGSTSGPDLTSVVVKPIKDAFGTITGYTATFVFDEDIATPANTAAFTLYDPDGTALPCGVVPTVGTTEDTDNTATCSSSPAAGGFAGATNTQLAGANLGTVDDGAVTEGQPPSGGLTNPEGAAGATQSA